MTWLFLVGAVVLLIAGIYGMTAEIWDEIALRRDDKKRLKNWNPKQQRQDRADGPKA